MRPASRWNFSSLVVLCRISAWHSSTATSSSMSHDPHLRPALTRRDVLVRAAHGFGSLALASLVDPPANAADRVNPLAARPPHFPGKAKSVIFLFMVGGPSQVDTF